VYRRFATERGFRSASRWYGAGWMVALGVFLLPMGLLGYGESLYSTWQGPAADGWSIYFRWTGTSGLTVSYRPVAEALFLWPARLAGATGVVDHLPEMDWATFLWLVAAPTYGLIAAVVGGFVVARRQASGAED
jgi:hypothetical protein